MIVVQLQGGLGNQMFQYAAGLRLAIKHRQMLKWDLTALLDRSPRPDFVYREYDLKMFNLPNSPASKAELRKFRRICEPGTRSILERIADKVTRRCYFREQTLFFDSNVLELPNDTYLEGYSNIKPIFGM